MVVRVRVRLKARSSGSTVETVALANSGGDRHTSREYRILVNTVNTVETAIPASSGDRHLVIPAPLADELGLDMADAVEELYEMASGIARVMRVPGALEISVITDDREEGPIVADAIVMDSHEVLLSDQAISALRIDFVDAAGGLWRFRDEPADRLRESLRPEIWVRRRGRGSIG